MPEPGLGGTPDYKYTSPGGLEKTTQETLGNSLSGGGDNPRGIAGMGIGTLMLLGVGLWYFWPKIKKSL